MKRSISFLIILILIFLPNCVNAFSINASPNEVKSGYEFDFVINIDENVYLANGHITFDATLFSFARSNTPGLEVKKVSDNEIAWMYTDTKDSPSGTNNLKFTFEAQDVIRNQGADFTTSDSIYITLDDHTYEGKELTQNVTIQSKDNLPLPSTGGIGKIIFIVGGAALMIAAIVILIKRNKKQ